MPYIKPEDQRTIAERPLLPEDPVGWLTFSLVSACLDWLDGDAVGYTELNAAIGALECAKLELYRRVAVPYEDEKAVINGDVFYERARPDLLD